MGVGAEIAQRLVSWLGYCLHFFFREENGVGGTRGHSGSYETDTGVML